MNKFLLDVNLSPQTGAFLRETFAFDVVRSTPPDLPDEEIVARAKREQRVIVTLDQDFGEIYYLRERDRWDDDEFLLNPTYVMAGLHTHLSEASSLLSRRHAAAP